MKKLVSTLLALVMLLALTTPALADMGYVPLNTDPEWLAWKDAWIEANPDAWAAFDPDLWFEQHYDDYYSSQEGYMEAAELTTREEFEAYMAEAWLTNIRNNEASYPWAEEQAAAHPEEYTAFDAEAWVETSWYNTKEGYMTMWQVDEETFRMDMWTEYVLTHYYHFDPQVRAWLDAHPEETAAFLDDIDAFVAERLYYPTVSEMAADLDTNEEYVRDMAVDLWAWGNVYKEEQEARFAAFEASHPGTLAELEANVHTYFQENYFWYDSAQEYMSDFGYTEEEFVAAMVEEQIEAIQAREETLNQLKESLGGVPGQVGVMLNGQYLSFPDAAPELVDGRVMVPYRALMEALGGDVEYDAAAQTVSCILADTALTLTLGENTLTIDDNGETSTLEMDCAAYIKSDRTYVPVRFVSQAFGYDVLWDQGFETAVLLDRQGVIDEINEQFNILNRTLGALTYNKPQSYQSQGNITADLTLFDSIGGDKTHHFTADSSTVAKGFSGQVSMTMDLSALGEIIDLDAILENEFYEYSDDEAAQMRALMDSLGDLSLEYIVNAEEKMVYLRSPQLGLFEEELTDSWLAWREEEYGWIYDLGDLTMGRLLYELALADVNTENDPDWYYMYSGTPVYAWSDLTDSAEQLAAVLGDDRFTHTDQGDVFTLDPVALGLDEEYDPFSELEFTFTVADNGTVTGSFQMQASGETLYDLTGGIGGTVCVCSGEFAFVQGKSSLTLDLHLKNLFRLELEVTATTGSSSTDPVTAPPEGDAVVYIEDGVYLFE